MNYLYEYANTLTSLSKESFDLVKLHLREKTFKAKTVLCNLEEEPNHIYFIKSGIIRAYTVNDKGGEFTKNLFNNNQFAGPLSALIQNKTSNLIYETITDCEVIEADYREIRELFNKHIDLMIFGHKILEMYFISLENRAIELATLTAKQRYLKLKDHFNDIENLIPQYHIASLLGITPIQLSRIRKDLHTKQ